MPLTVDVWKKFAPEQLQCGGLGPHLEMMSRIARETFDTRLDRAWFIGCYIGPYVPSTGYELWRKFPAPEMVTEYPDELRAWINVNWDGLPVRRGDRRGACWPNGLAKLINSYAKWCINYLDPTGSYESIRDSALEHIDYAGRFTIIKLMEALYRANVIECNLDNGIWPAGAQSGPRKALQQLADDWGGRVQGWDGPDLVSGDGTEACNRVNRAARWAERLLDGSVPPLSWFELEGLLCDARQAVKGRYPGRALDEDLEYAARTYGYFGSDADSEWFFEWREKLFPASSLGEIGGWDGRRRELERAWSV